MWTYYPELLSTPVPRYTSYPTAAEFGNARGSADLEAALAKADTDVSLYVHIPFCEQICWYCGCNTNRNNRTERLESYLDALHTEIALIGERLPRSARVKRIAFGGGSPNAVTPVDFVRLMLSLTQAFRIEDPVISVEIDPRSMTKTWADTLASVGVRQASLGVQTFDPGVQAAIGRVQPLHLIQSSNQMLRQAGVSSINFDLMYGLPGQTLEMLESTLEQAVALSANRIALFGYAHVPHLIARQRRIDSSALPDQQARFTMAARGHDILQDAGYTPVGFDHFALPGDPLAQAALSGRLRRNFQGFTDDDAPVLIGLGASAISSFPELLVQNEKNIGRYQMMLSQGRPTARRGIRRTSDDQVRGSIIENLLCTGRAMMGDALLGEVRSRLAPFARKGLIETNDGALVLTSGALPYTRTIAAVFDSYRPASPTQFSAAV
jgi:oxygen-independent coproporphyrinogen III oxidase